MKYMFLDESGELGFNFERGSTKFFTINLLVCGFREEQDLKRVIKKIRRKVLRKDLRKSNEIKWNNSNDLIKRKVFERIERIDFEVFSIILDKSKVYDYLRDNKHKLYNYLSNMIINECSIDGKIELVVDRSKNKRSLRDDFDNYIRDNLKKECLNLTIQHTDSKSKGGLQVLDFVSGAIFNKYGFNNLKYYNKIKNKITTEKEFP